jgi:hypothetical protein
MSTATMTEVALAVSVQARLARFALEAPTTPAGPVPALALTLTLASPTTGAPLVSSTTTGLRIGSAVLGGAFSAAGGAVVATLIDATPSSSEPAATIDIAGALASSIKMQRLARLLEALVVFVAQQLESERAAGVTPTLGDAAMALLEDVELVRAQGKLRLIEPLSWLALLADPGGYVAGEVQRIGADKDAMQAFASDLAALLGVSSFTPPEALWGLDLVLAAFGLLAPTPRGAYLPVVSAWIALAEDPVGFLTSAGGPLFGSSAAVTDLVSALTAFSTPSAVRRRAELTLPAWLTFTIDKGTRVELGIGTAAPLRIGSDVAFAGSLALDLKALTVAGSATAWSPDLGAGLQGAVTATVGSGDTVATTWQLALAAPPDAAGAIAPVPLYGNPQPQTAAQLVETAPLLALSTVSAALLNGFVIPASPLAGRILVALGVAEPEGGTPHVGSLLGVATDPVGWITGPKGFGDGSGGIDFTRHGHVLAALPGAGVDGPDGITLKADEAGDGMTLAGLPFGGSLTIAAGAAGLSLAAGVEEAVDAVDVKLGLTLAYDPRTGLSFGSTNAVTVTIDESASVTVDAGYAGTGFGLALSGTSGGTRFPAQGTIELVPFGGLNQYLAEGAEALLAWFATKALDALAAVPNPPAGLTALVAGLKQTAAVVGVKDVPTLVAAAKSFEDDPLGWLAKQFADPGTTLTYVEQLLKNTFGIQEVQLSRSGDDIVVVYTLTSSVGALTLLFGQRKLGSALVFGGWLEPSATIGPLVLAVEAGVGAVTPLSASSHLDFSLQATASLASGYVPTPFGGSPTLIGVVDGEPGGTWSFDARLYPAGSSSTDSVYVSLLPTVGLGTGPAPGALVAPEDAAAWLAEFAYTFVLPFVAQAALGSTEVQGWLATKLGSTVSVASVLEGAGVLVGNAQQPLYVLQDVRALYAGKGAAQILETLLAQALPGLVGTTLVPVAGGGIEVVDQSDGAGGFVYGLGIQIPSITLTTDPATFPQVTVRLGAEPTLATDWLKRVGAVTATPGIGIDLLHVPQAGVASATLEPGLTLVDVGFDLTGADKKPLVDVSGFQLGGVELRLYLSLLDSGGLQIEYGAAIETDAIAVPLGSQLDPSGSGGGTNPIAANLLSSGGDGSSTKPVNPAFSASAAYVSGGHKPEVRFYKPDGTPTQSIAIPVQRSLGPLYCRQVGFGYAPSPANRLDVGFDGSVQLAGLAVDLVNLDVGIELGGNPFDPSTYTLGLDGLDVTFNGGPVSLNGGLLKQTVAGELQYIGTVSVKAEQFGITALGAYALLKSNQPSFFVFGALEAPLGGPAFFFVTGIAAGFGYNRDLILPAQDGVLDFPLVAGVIDPTMFAGATPDEALGKLGAAVPPRAGEYWLAAGVQFTSFEQLQSFALLAVTFGTEFTVAVLGVSTLAVPSQVEDGGSIAPIAQATLELEAMFKPAAGYLAVTAVLAPDSYVLAPEAQLTGGFALEVWFGGEHAGQFVVTLGGYNPAWQPPSYFPQEPRLGLNWPLGPVQIKGGCYFALTPSAVMAGGSLSVVYSEGALKAWLDASADFLVEWKPFRFDAEVSISIGVSYRVDVWFVHHTFSVELGADLSLWGTPVGGKVHVSWYIISFTVGFGPAPQANAITSWQQFDSSFLPQQTTDGQKLPDPKVSASVAGGLVATLDQSGRTPNTEWIVNPLRFRLVTHSVIPSTAVTWNTAAGVLAMPSDAPTALGVRPLRSTGSTGAPPTLTTTHDIGLTKDGVQVNPPPFVATAVQASVPAALWSPAAGGTEPGAETIPHALLGWEFVPITGPKSPTGLFPVTNLGVPPPTIPVAWKPPTQPATPTYSQQNTVPQLMTALQSATVAAELAQLTAGLAVASPQLALDGVPQVLAVFADQILQAPVNLVALGGQLVASGGDR